MLAERKQYNDAFAEALAMLDSEQRRAVDHIEGPVAVIAGPGAGKTHILASRIGRILSDTDTQAHHILCLTFTDAAVHALRKRLLSLIGPEAHRVQIFTFHAFCNSIIQDNIELFGKRNLEPISELELIALSRKLLESLPPEHPLRRKQADPHSYERQLRGLFSLMKTECWTPEVIHTAINDYLTSLPERPEFIYTRNGRGFTKGDIKLAAIEEVRERMERLRAAADLYPTYLQAMKEASRYDYDDMIRWVIDVFEHNQQILRNYQERYLYFMVDEFQDTNGAQNTILTQLTSYWDEPNIFIVGDDDQSVYEFQGARLKNLTDFIARYHDTIELVVLPYNYRSSQPILDAATSVIQHNQLRVVRQVANLEKKLIAQNPELANAPDLPQIRLFSSRLQETTAIIAQIAAWQDAGVNLSDIAILYASHKQVAPLQAMLERKGIPFQTKRKTNILTLPLIQQLKDLLRYLDREYRFPGSADDMLYRLLHLPFFSIPAADLGRLSLCMAKLADPDLWRKALRNTSLLETAGVQQPDAFEQVANFFDELIVLTANEPLPALLEKVINRSGLINSLNTLPDPTLELQALRSFMDFTQEEAARQPDLSLEQLLDILEQYKDNHIPLEISQSIGFEQGVVLSTAHSAKGLEFDYVFIIDAVKESWEPRTQGGGNNFSLPDTLVSAPEEDAMEARRRLFYVAMTRAKRWLQISYSTRDDKGKALTPAVFVDEIREAHPALFQQAPPDISAATDNLKTSLTEAPTGQFIFQDPRNITSLLDNFSLSISALNRYLNCPLEFYYAHILRLPGTMSEQAAYGTAMHKALQRFFERMLADREKKFPDRVSLLYFFEDDMKRLHSKFSRARFEQFVATGKSRLSALYDQPDWYHHREVKIEYAIRRASCEGIPITGSIDKIEFYEHTTLRVVDYKTGKPDPKKIAPPSAKNPKGSPYWRQLAFYKILYENFDQSSRFVKDGAITFLDPDAEGRFQTLLAAFEPEHIRQFKALMVETYHRIMAQDFFPGCEQADCIWCNFARQQRAPDSFNHQAIDELDDNQ
jgi:DNA helicase II / ATP-dependent DNA helicase PcrA